MITVYIHQIILACISICCILLYCIFLSCLIEQSVAYAKIADGFSNFLHSVSDFSHSLHYYTLITCNQAFYGLSRMDFVMSNTIPNIFFFMQNG